MMDMEMRIRIRKAYAECDLTPMGGRMISPYSVGIDWMMLMTPIEDRVWDAIRYLCLPLYPQYPVGPFFLDFGDPIRKIGIEVDSWRWHQDQEKDERRQRQIEGMGWTIYRIPSTMVFTSRPNYEDEDGVLDEKRFKAESAEGFLWDLYRNFRFEVG